MTLTFNVFGFEIARVELDIGEDEPPVLKPVEKATKAVSRWWMRKII